MYRKLSNGISWALHPFLLPLYMIGVLLTLTVFAHYPSGVKIYLLWVVALYAIIIPLLALGVLRSLGRISDYRIDDRCWWAPCAMCCAPLRSPKFPPPSSCVSS